ncbi:MAG: xanthine dehydrogenase molybdopterin binding subunit [Proteobacteria bacterium]|nr:xanthine dehydrogenase molybdopterin binding subunit [Pseudomonadota bacterium]
MTAVGKPIPHDSALGHVTGEALFIDDMPFTQNEVLVDFFGSPVAHGKILSLDLSQAKKVDGIIDIYTYRDIPGHNLFGPMIPDEPFLAEEICEYKGQPVAILAGKTDKALLQAKKLIQINIEEYPAILTVDQALEKEQFLGVQRKIQRGNVQTAFEEAEHSLEGTIWLNGQEQFYLESQAALAYPGEEGQITIHSSTQNPTEIQQVVAEALGLGQHQVVSICKRMGGGFGGKETQAAIPAVMAALVAVKNNCPARIAYTKDDDMKVTGKRHPYKIRYKVAFTRKGNITGLTIDFYSNGGATADLSPSVLERSMLHAENAYYLPNVEITGLVCKTNLPPNTAFRGFGGPQAIVAIENIIEEIAIHLGKDALDIRLLNCYGKTENNVAPYGAIIRNHVLQECFVRLVETSEYHTRLKKIRTFNQQSHTHLKGISLTPVKFGISFTSKFMNQASALVNIYRDGTVQVSTGGTEMGQGLNTKLRQIVADELGISYKNVILMPTSTEKNNNASPTAASAGTDLNGLAAVNACQKIRKNLTIFASQHFASVEKGLSPSTHAICFEAGRVFDERDPENQMPFSDFVRLAYMNRVNLGARGFYRTPNVDFNRETGKGNPFFYYTTGCAVAEVTIDRFTGDLKVERSDVLMDIGESINPGIDRGQITGGFIQGMGWLTTEELRYQDQGDLLSYSPTTYKIPNIQDTPEVFNFDCIHNPMHHINVRRSKAVGEPPLMMSICVWTAVKHALSFLKKNNIPRLNVPATNEEILKRITQYTTQSASIPKEQEIPVIQ